MHSFFGFSSALLGGVFVFFPVHVWTFPGATTFVSFQPGVGPGPGLLSVAPVAVTVATVVCSSLHL
jgi:hypothetical protein